MSKKWPILGKFFNKIDKKQGVPVKQMIDRDKKVKEAADYIGENFGRALIKLSER